MVILYRREQYRSVLGPMRFRLWGKIELDETESDLIDTYGFRHAILIASFDWELVKICFWIGLIVWFLSVAVFNGLLGYHLMQGIVFGFLIGLVVALVVFNENRQTLLVRDLLHGRTFKCRSVIGLIQKEAALENAASLLRQIVESAKHWDGTETVQIEPLPHDEAKQFVFRAFPNVA